MTRPRGAIRRGSGSIIAHKDWSAACIDGSDIDLALNTVAAFTMFTFSEPETFLRVRGEIYVELNGSAVNERATLACGLAVVSARAAAVGTTAIPRPGSEGVYPWIWHGWMNVSTLQEAAVVPDAAFSRLSVDSKAMRKVKEDEVIILAFEICESVDQGGHLSVLAGLRALAGD